MNKIRIWPLQFIRELAVCIIQRASAHNWRRYLCVFSEGNRVCRPKGCRSSEEGWGAVPHNSQTFQSTTRLASPFRKMTKPATLAEVFSSRWSPPRPALGPLSPLRRPYSRRVRSCLSVCTSMMRARQKTLASTKERSSRSLTTQTVTGGWLDPC